MKKLTISVLILALTAGLVFAAGGTQSSGGAAGKTARVGVKGSLPLATSKPTLSMLVSLNADTTSFAYADNAFTKKTTDVTGVNLNITAAPMEGGTARLNAMLAAGDYPEIIDGFLSFGELDYYAQQGILKSLDEYDLMSFPNIAKRFTESPTLNQVIKGTDGKTYALPTSGACPQCTFGAGRIFYHMPWVRDNNRKMPTTLDEFTDFLRWIRDNDVNKNGDRNDEIPMAFSGGDTHNVISFFAKAFLPFNGGSYRGLVLNSSKKIVEQYKDPAFRQALQYINSLYKEGLIVQDSFTMTGDQLRELVQSPVNRVGILGTTWQHSATGNPSLRFTETFQLSPLAGPTGQRWAANQTLTANMSPRWFITDKCKDPELAIALYDYFMDWQVQIEGYWGPKGSAWVEAVPGDVALGGGKAVWRLLVGESATASKNNTSWKGAFPNNYTEEWWFNGQVLPFGDKGARYLDTGDPSLVSVLADDGAYLDYFFVENANRQKQWAIPESYFITPLLLNDTDSTRNADIGATLDTYKTQAWVEFITGARNISNNTEWNAYLADLDRFGAAEQVAIYQKYIK
jgi:putative aldouronate transport system substrate-binding protein